MTLVSNHSFPRHAHDQFGIGLIAFGGHRSWSALGSVDAVAGDIIMCNPGEMHDGIPLNGRSRGWQMVYLDPVFLARQCEEEVNGELEMVRPVATDSDLARAFSRLFHCLTAANPDPLERDERLVSLLSRMLLRHASPRPHLPVASPAVKRAVRRLDSAPEGRVSLAELAALARASRFQLLRAFVRELGITPHAYLVQKRVQVARNLLRLGWTPVEAALQAGFADQSHMTRAFVRQFGVTPARYQAAIS